MQAGETIQVSMAVMAMTRSTPDPVPIALRSKAAMEMIRSRAALQLIMVMSFNSVTMMILM